MECNIIGNDERFLSLELNDSDITKFSIYSLLGWLKSSPFIWYKYRKYDTANIYHPSVLRNIIIPNLECLQKNGIVEKCVQQIISNETEFIQAYKGLDIKLYSEINPEDEMYDYKKELINEQLLQVIQEHNTSTEILAKQIDEEILNELNVSSNELKWISDDIDAEGIYNILDLHNNN